MGLDKNTLKQEIINILNDMKDETDQASAIQHFADRLATAIDEYVKTATVSTTVTVTCPSGTGTGTGTGSLS